MGATAEFLRKRSGDEGEDAEEYDGDDEHDQEVVAGDTESRNESIRVEWLTGGFCCGRSIRGTLRRRAVGERESRHQVEERVGGEHDECAEDDFTPARLEDAGQRHLRDFARLDDFLKRGGLDELEAHIEPDGHEKGARKERHTPPPRLELLGRECDRQKKKNTVGGDEADRGSHLRKGAVDRPLSLGGVLGREQGGTAPLATEAEPLGEAHDDEERGSCDLPAGSERGRQASDQHGCDAHRQQRGHEGAFTSDAITEMAEDDRTDRACDESGPERGERTEQ